MMKYMPCIAKYQQRGGRAEKGRKKGEIKLTTRSVVLVFSQQEVTRRSYLLQIEIEIE